MTAKPTRVLAIGLDSAEPSLVESWVQEGKLPLFGRLMREGCYGRLRSTVPPLTPPAWTSSLTGTNPGKHNVFDFFRITSNHSKEVASSADRQSKPLWRILESYGKRSIVINLPNTFPADEFNGVMVAGMPLPRRDTGFVTPAALRDEVLELIEGRFLGISHTHLLQGDIDKFLEDLEAVTARITKLGLHLMKTREWDFTMVVYDDLDRLQHVFWHHMDPNHPFHDPEKADRYQDVLLRFYQYLENQIQALLDALDDDTLLLVYSDHWMGPVYKNLYVNTFFQQNGWLKIKAARPGLKTLLEKTGVSFEDIRLLMGKLGLRRVLRRLVPVQIKRALRQCLPAEGVDLEIIDWSRTLDWKNSKAYLCSKTGHGVMVNRANVDDYEAFRDAVIAALEGLRDPDTGEPVVRKVHRREDIYHGPCVQNAPDLIVDVNEIYQVQEKIGESVIAPLQMARVPIAANHRPEGLYMLSGSGRVDGGKRLDGVNIMDIAPTILYGMGLPVPEEMDGKAAKAAFGEGFRADQPEAQSAMDLSEEGKTEALSESDRENVQTRLRDLGYID